MKNFIFKSTAADLQKMFQLLETKLEILNQNVLYITHRIDIVNKVVKEMQTNNSLQKQVDEYFEDDQKDIPEEKPE